MLIRKERLDKDICLGLWRISIPEGHGQKRRLEQEAERALLAEMLGGEVDLAHNADGKPMIDGYNVSISHTRGILAIMLSRGYSVGVDVEYMSDRVTKIASRFLRSDEQPSTTLDLLLHWCAKEAMFKLRSESHLTYEQMRVDLCNRVVHDMLAGDAVSFKCQTTEEYALVWMKELDR